MKIKIPLYIFNMALLLSNVNIYVGKDVTLKL